MKEYQEAFGAYVKMLRKDKGYTQNQFAELADLSPGYLSAVERGIANPRLDTIKKLAKGFDIAVPDLFLFEVAASKSDGKELKEKLIGFIDSLDKETVENIFRSMMHAMLKK